MHNFFYLFSNVEGEGQKKDVVLKIAMVIKGFGSVSSILMAASVERVCVCVCAQLYHGHDLVAISTQSLVLYTRTHKHILYMYLYTHTHTLTELQGTV